ncbi:MAG: hypothetical protein GXO57_07410 [Thermodesulfobacteria bacterium]|nr:hypothetical protein [Thermodesulfobacteriota bacterium]
MSREFRLVLVSLFAIFLTYGLAQAHKVSVFAYREADQIVGMSYFSGGTPCKHCEIIVYDSKGKEIATTKTDEKGNFKVKVKYTGPVTVKVLGGEGHVAEFHLEGLKEEEAIGENTQNETQVSNETVSETSQTTQVKGISPQELKRIVREVVAEETAPIKSMLLELEKEMAAAKIHDVLGGIGYIFGVWGLFALIRRRKG